MAPADGSRFLVRSAAAASVAPLPGHDETISAVQQRSEVCAGTKSARAVSVTVQPMTETRRPIRFDDLVDDVMSRSPQTIGVFLEFRMRCVGCPIACFHTVDDACREHGVDRDAFFEALCARA
jgi:hybrid cluster-associated redox disulfide protein